LENKDYKVPRAQLGLQEALGSLDLPDLWVWQARRDFRVLKELQV